MSEIKQMNHASFTRSTSPLLCHDYRFNERFVLIATYLKPRFTQPNQAETVKIVSTYLPFSSPPLPSSNIKQRS